jgi:hypothetical protein
MIYSEKSRSNAMAAMAQPSSGAPAELLESFVRVDSVFFYEFCIAASVIVLMSFAICRKKYGDRNSKMWFRFMRDWTGRVLIWIFVFLFFSISARMIVKGSLRGKDSFIQGGLALFAAGIIITLLIYFRKQIFYFVKKLVLSSLFKVWLFASVSWVLIMAAAYLCFDFSSRYERFEFVVGLAAFPSIAVAICLIAFSLFKALKTSSDTINTIESE